MQPVNRTIVAPNISESAVQLHPDNAGTERRRINASVISAIIADHYLMIIGLAVLLAAGAVAWAMWRPQKFTASVTVAPVGNARQLNIPSSIAGSLLGSMNSGIQATPVFVSRLARLHSVLEDVARSDVPGRRQTVIEGVMRRPKAEIPPYKYAQEIDKVLQTTVDRESGTVTFGVALADSALARAMVNTLVEGVSRAYTRSMKSQAGELVAAQAARVDSAAKRVRLAGSALVAFESANRVVPNTSTLWVDQQRLQANVTIAQDVYTQAVTELENARGRAIEDAPALVVLDPVPIALPPRERRLVLVGLGTFVLSALVLAVFVLVREAATNVYATGDRDIVRLVSSLERVPLFGKLAVRWFVRP